MEYLIPIIFFLIYEVTGFFVLNRWTEGLPHRRLWDLKRDPEGWLRYGFPYLILAEGWVLSGGWGFWGLVGVVNFFLHTQDGVNYSAAADSTFEVVAGFCVMVDLVVVVVARRMARARR